MLYYAYMNNSHNDLFARVKKSRVFSHIVSTLALDKKKVLDVGCSEGHHLACFGSESVGITIIPVHVEEGKKRGLSILEKNVEDEHFMLDETFDAIWANNIFEHLNQPHPFLIKMRSVLKEDGVLILGVPVIPFFSFLTRFKKFRGAYAVSHVNFFTRKTLIETVRAAGWHVHEARLFYMQNAFLDSFFNLIAPHIYVVASARPDFAYARKRLLSLDGYHKDVKEPS